MGKLTVGQKLWYVPKNGPSREVSVTRIGRKWAELDINRRLDIERLLVMQGSYTCGRVHIDRGKWEAEQERLQVIGALRSRVTEWGFGNDAPIENLRQAASLLGIELPARSDTGETNADQR